MTKDTSKHQQTPPDLATYTTQFSRGRPAIVEAIWMMVQWLFVSSWIPGSMHRRLLLKA
ncbi:MAG: hypothetical protein HRT81_15110, partial [Henriciella sp.]|nr:hypothetical protein [Henriciella sp.]